MTGNTFASPRPLADLLVAIEREVIEADASFQIAQAHAWNELGRNRPLLAGYDRLANLGLIQLSITLCLVQVGCSLFRRLWNWITRKAPDPRYRVCTARDSRCSMKLTLCIERNGAGRWKTTTTQA